MFFFLNGSTTAKKDAFSCFATLCTTVKGANKLWRLVLLWRYVSTAKDILVKPFSTTLVAAVAKPCSNLTMHLLRQSRKRRKKVITNVLEAACWPPSMFFLISLLAVPLSSLKVYLCSFEGVFPFPTSKSEIFRGGLLVYVAKSIFRGDFLEACVSIVKKGFRGRLLDAVMVLSLKP